MLRSHFVLKTLRRRIELLPSITKRFILEYPIMVGENLWLQDIMREDLISISESLGQPYLSETKEEPKFPVSGMVYSSNGRRCVNLIVERGEKKIYVPFIINSGSAMNVISEDTVKALGMSELAPLQVTVTLHGFKRITCNFSANEPKLKHVNLLGYQFFQETKVCEFYNADTMELTLHKSMSEFFKTITNK